MNRIRFSILLLLTVLIPFNLSSQNETIYVTSNSWPKDLASFDTFRNEQSTTPQGALISLVAALDLYSKNKEEGTKALILVVDSSHLSQDVNGYKGFSLSRNLTDLVKRQIEQHPYLIGSYLPGSSASNGYVPGSEPYSFTITANRFSGTEESGQRKLFIPSSGADSARPVTLKRNAKGVWKAQEFSSLLVGIKKPDRKNAADDL
ncbi:hypothetical protein DLM76_05505 [Leptospira yasudae]|uniref:DUF6935 domain-containing protein n=1 Tax=Leptospira yasudae TaxID=2202201 RepID=A0ABX9MA76_9LEPT|nr:hypothetical protein [Leptospira yasudae]RHX82397.1 hypothetical protein DLM77_02820 [Leptospira yasudae]RHX94800.1 hypothetical protein DLM76_05505 [Leptospira yasudae]TGK30215.1 hypothetical protein EHQ05_04455 [Leptospira yasudae]TGM04405.1 hypothetical protein EHQ86_14280 [Leptospira yasudae]